MDILFQGSVAKFAERPAENEDAFTVNTDRNRIVLCDGASESFDAKSWAQVLVEAFATDDLLKLEIEACQERYHALHDVASMSWSKAAAYERGSFSTMLIAQEDFDAQRVWISCVGDSLAVLTDGERILESLPYRNAIDFDGRPVLLSTEESHNSSFWMGEAPSICSAQWGYRDRDLYLLCMTDALGAWLLGCAERGDYDALKCLVGIRSSSELSDLVEFERHEQAMRRDDVTLIVALLKGRS